MAALRDELPTPGERGWAADMQGFADAIDDKIDSIVISPGGSDVLRPWYAALARRNGRRANVGMIGASLVEGAFVSDYALTLPQQLAATLRQRHPTVGLGSSGGRGYTGIPSWALVTAPDYVPGAQPWAFADGTVDPVDPAASAFHHGARHSLWYTVAPGAHCTLTLDEAVTSAEIVHILGPSGHATGGYYKIDGGTGVGFSTGPATPAAVQRLAIGPATTSIEVGCQGTGYLLLSGVHEYAGDEDKGIQVHNLGHAGYDTAEWALSPSTAGGWLPEIVGLDLDVLILQDLGGNDGGGGATAATFETRLRSFVQVLRAGGVDCPIVLSSIPDVTEGLPMPSPWSSYVAAHAAVAGTEAGCVHLDLSARIPASPATGLDIYHADDVHARADGGLLAWIVESYATLLTPA